MNAPGGRGRARRDPDRVVFRAREHVGMIAAVVLSLVAFLGIVALAILGFEPAFGLLVFVLVGLGLIAAGTRMRG